MTRNIKLYLHYSLQNIRALLEYKNDLIVSTVAGAIWQGVGLVFLFALFGNIRSVGGWTLYEVALLYGCIMFGEGVLTLLFQGSTGFAYRIRNGDMDRFIVRPVPLLTQILGLQINFAGLFTMGNATALIIVSLGHLHATVTAGQIILFFINILFGVWIRVNFNIACNAFAFIFKTVGSLGTLFYYTQAFGKYPASIYPKAIQVILFTIIPHAVISYLPVSILLGKLPAWPYELGILASCVFIGFLTKWLFDWAITKYESAGN